MNKLLNKIENGFEIINGVLVKYTGNDTNIIIPNGVIGIGISAFEGCGRLTSIIIPNSVKTIGNSAFRKCESLTNIIISNSVTAIESSTFRGCSALKSIVIPDSVKSIGDFAFHGCSSLENVIISNNITSIGSWSFAFCNKLRMAMPPKNITIGHGAFYKVVNTPNYITNKIKYENYIKVIKRYIQNNLFIGLNECPETTAEIVQCFKPTFEYLGIKTWIIEGNKGFQIMWEGNGDWNAGYTDMSLKEFRFREYPCFKNI